MRATSSAVVNEGRHPRRSLTTSSPPATTTRASADTATEKLIEDRLAVLRWPRNRGPLWRTTCTTGRIWPRTRPGGPDQGPERQLVPIPDPAPGRHDVGERATFADCVPDGEGSAAGAAQVAQRPGQLVPTGSPLLLVLGVGGFAPVLGSLAQRVVAAVRDDLDVHERVEAVGQAVAEPVRDHDEVALVAVVGDPEPGRVPSHREKRHRDAGQRRPALA